MRSQRGHNHVNLRWHNICTTPRHERSCYNFLICQHQYSFFSPFLIKELWILFPSQNTALIHISIYISYEATLSPNHVWYGKNHKCLFSHMLVIIFIIIITRSMPYNWLAVSMKNPFQISLPRIIKSTGEHPLGRSEDHHTSQKIFKGPSVDTTRRYSDTKIH